MFVLSKRNIILTAPDGSAVIQLRAGMMETIPDWAAKTSYFRALVADGKSPPAPLTRRRSERWKRRLRPAEAKK